MGCEEEGNIEEVRYKICVIFGREGKGTKALTRPGRWDRMEGNMEQKTWEESKITAFKMLSAEESARSLNKGLSWG